MLAITIASDLIKQFEGLRLNSYYCPAGHKTIGYGHVIEPQEQIGNRIDKQQAEDLLEKDIRKAETILYRYCRVPLTKNQQAALISFIFNCGGGAFQASTLRQKLNRGEYLNAANELLRWVNAKGRVKLQGLVKRRTIERSLFLN
ncbi:lysozyme [Rickettsia endosymbiont of Orchestes rusci]|uniref:lysozyme n=1 Tax=Rickettsia endosymbiont of Orchestes rusci TaxID=3066250 RepID=UPI00313BEFB6